MERLALEQVTLGTSSLRVSRVALGMMSYGADPERAWALDAEAAEPIVRYAVENGFTFFDTADMYSNGASEVVTGRLVRKLLPREEAVVATKVFYPVEPGGRGGLSRAHILEAIDASLGRLQMVALLPYSPLAQGFLAGTQSRQGARHTERARARSTTDGMYSRSCDFDISERVAAIASERGVPPA
jgi:aryl-alcohol dehydrogenase-like predicted oxidoreductase